MARAKAGIAAMVFVGVATMFAMSSIAAAQQPDAAKAREEKKIVSYGQPDDWANWKEIWQVFCARHGCTHEDTDMSSAEEIAKFKAERNNPVGDTAEIGMIWGPVAVREGVAAPYKGAGWDKVPDWAKDPDGRWVGLYVGVLTFAVNTAIVKNVPRSWADLLKPEYKNSIVISDPRTSGTGVATFLSATFAMGGDEKNLDPGFKYFAQLYKAGNMKAVGRNLANVQKGEAPITIGYDLQAAVWRDRLKGQVPLEVVVPSEGVFFMPGALMINQWAPHPNLARLFTDFVLSDEGQRLFAKGYAHPIRVVAGNLTLAADQNPRPITQLGSNTKYVRDWTAASVLLRDVAQRWAQEVLGQ
jgi:putative spermidine/putrescine transport system substrate-binding protein